MPKNRLFREPPLAFSGNKKYWAAELMDEAALLPAGATVWDVFGGSGVCARCIKDARPDVRVVWDDFDRYSDRLLHIAESEELRKALLLAVGADGSRTPGMKGYHARLTADDRQKVQSVCRQHFQRFGFFDGLLVRRWLSIGAAKDPYDLDAPPTNLYARVPTTPLKLPSARDWLRGLEVVSMPARELPIKSGDYVILDPPYVSTNCSEYGGRDTFSGLRASADLLRSHKFILFGDASISFFYEILTERWHPRFFVKNDLVCGIGGSKRTEVMYSNW